MIPGSANALLLATAAPTGYNISRSLRFNSADSAYLSRTPASAGNRKTWTWAGWVKRSAIAFSAEQHIWGVTGTTDATYGEMFFGTGDTLRFAVGYNTAYGITTTRVFRDASAWYHIVLAFDATQSTAANKIKLYINGVEETTFSSDNRSSLANQDWGYNNNVAHYIGRQANSDIRHFNGYLADIHFIDGQALDPTSFGEFSATTGVWVPKAYTGSFGTNGFHLPFDDNSTAAALGYDAAGSNDWTVNNISVTAGAGNDSLVDVPTNGTASSGGDAGGVVRGNYCTWNPLINGDSAANGNLDVTNDTARGTHKLLDYDAYWEITSTGGTTTAGVVSDGGTTNTTTVANGKTYGFKLSTTGSLDYINITDAGSFTNIATGLTGIQFPYASAASATTGSLNAGQRPFAYTAPSGFKALCTANLPSTTITTSGSYTGNGVADGPFVYLNGVPTAMTVGGNAVTFGTHADKLSNGFKIRTTSTTYNQNALTYNYTITTTGDPFKYARAQSNP